MALFMSRKGAGLALVCTLLAGCANLQSVYRNRHIINEDQVKSAVVTIDAKQRALAVSVLGQGKDARLRYCAEQAPDIFSALSSSFTAEAASDEADKGINARLATAIAESAGAIERTQTVNLLAMSMYRTCERFLNGELEAWELPWQAAREQRMLVTVMAIEQLTNMVRPRLVRTPTLSGGSAGGVAVQASQLEAAKSKSEQADVAQQAANKAYQDVLAKAPAPKDGEQKTCESIADDTEKTACVTARDALAKAASHATAQAQYFQTLLRLANASGVQAQGAQASDGNVTNVVLDLDQASVVKIADTVYKLADLGVTVDYRMENCRHAMAAQNRLEELAQGQPRVESMRLRVDALCLDAFLKDQKAGGTQTAGSTQVGTTTHKSTRPASAVGGTGPAVWQPPVNGQVNQLSQASRPRIYPQVATAALQSQLDKTLGKLKQVRSEGYRLYPTEHIARYRGANIVRFFYESDQEGCDLIKQELDPIITPVVTCRYIAGYESTVQPGLYEIWLGADAAIKGG